MSLRFKVQCRACGQTSFFKEYASAVIEFTEHRASERFHIVTLETIEYSEGDAACSNC